jgi:hypothetical protein
MNQDLQPITARFDIDSDKFVTLERDTVTDTTHVNLHDTFMATITRLASFCDGKFKFYTNNNTSQFIRLMRSQPALSKELSRVSIPVDEFDHIKSNISKALNKSLIIRTINRLTKKNEDKVSKSLWR